MSEELRQANKYLNLIKNKAKRKYGFAYLDYLKNGCYGNEPEHPGIGGMGAQAVRMSLLEILGPEPFKAVGNPNA